MQRKPTLRTYGRKAGKPSVDISLASNVPLTQRCPEITKSCVLLDENTSNSFLDHDPFETTFDKVAKGAVVPPLPLSENNSWNISSSDGTISITSQEYPNSFTFHDNISTSSSDNVKRPLRECRVQQRSVEPHMTVLTGSISCKNVKKAQVLPNILQLTVTKYNDIVEASKHTPIKSQHDSNSFVIDDHTSDISWDKDNSINEAMNETETKKNILSTNLVAPTISSCEDVNVAAKFSKKRKNEEDLIKDCYVKLMRLKLKGKEKNVQLKRLKVEVKKEKDENKEEKVEIIDAIENTTVFSEKKKRHIICSTPINNKYIRSIHSEALISPVEKHNITLEPRSEYSIISKDNKSDTVLSDQKNFLFTSKYSNTVEKKAEAQVSDLQIVIGDIKKGLMTPVEHNTKASITNNQSLSLFSDNTDDKLELESAEAIVSLHSSSGQKQQLNGVNISECVLSTTPCVSTTESIEKKELLENKNICMKIETYVRRDSKEEKYEIFCERDRMITISKQQHQKVFEKNRDETDEMLQLQDPIKITEKRIQHVKRSKNIDKITLSSNDNNDNAVIHPKIAESSNNIEDFNDKINTPVKKDLIQVDSSNNNCTEESQVFLKPGKSWMRSLSILNNIKDGVNLQKLSVGKGKKWRQSVTDVLNMQKQGISHDCSEKDPLHEVPDVKSDVSSLEKCNKTFISNIFPKKVSMVRVLSNISFDQCSDISFPVGISERRPTSTKGEDYPEFKSYQEEESNIEYNNISCRTDHVATAKDILLQRCSQKCYQLFSKCFPDSYLKYCRKIGEGVYGEVFLYKCEDEVSVIKIIPIEGDQLVNGEPQKKFNEVFSEIVIAEELHKLRDGNTYKTDGFVELKSIKCIIGRYPKELIKLWNEYDNEKKSDNDCPSMFDENQLYIVLELGHGGKDLESFVFEDASETCALLLQIAFTLAMAEKALEFEHRDMHWGNILVSRTEVSYVCYIMDGKEIKIPSNGIKVSIIDFTLSRMSYNKGCCIYNDLALDPSLFTAYGDYQFEVYRLMRDKIENNWQKFEPYTNILWLHYTIGKMIKEVNYKRTRLKKHKQAICKLKELKNVILDYDNMFDFVSKCDKITRLRVELM